MSKPTDTAVRFFYANAGWSYHPAKETPEEGHQRCAERLAAAEVWASENAVSLEWEEDEYADRSFLPKRDNRPLFSCLRRTHDGRIASCGGIDLGRQGTESKVKGGGKNYMRVMAAELALELMPEGEK